LIVLVALADSEAIRALGGTTALLLLGVFAFVNVAVLVLRRDKVKHEHFRINRIIPWLGAAACLFLVTPLTGRDVIQYQVAGWLLLLGVVMWGVTYMAHRREARMELDPASLE
jgi:APA family basic amino acid/polyamine antiporter